MGVDDHQQTLAGRHQSTVMQHILPKQQTDTVTAAQVVRRRNTQQYLG